MTNIKRIKRAVNWLISQGYFSSQKEIGEKLGITNRSYLSQLVNAENPNEEFINKFIEIAPQISALWLLTGEGEMLIERQYKIEEHDIESSMVDGNDFGEQYHITERMIPFYDAETSGGYSGLVASSSEQANLKGYIQAGGWFDSKETAAIRHIGDSMVEYPSGCVLAVREVLDRRLLVPGRNYVIETTEFRVTKRYQRGSSPDTIALYSTNTETYPDGRLVHEPFEVPVDEIRRIYRVLGYIVNESGEFKIIKK